MSKRSVSKLAQYNQTMGRKLNRTKTPFSHTLSQV